MELTVLKLLPAQKDKYLMEKMDVYVLKEHIGLDLGVRLMVVQVDKFGTDLNVPVSLVSISMEAYVCFVLMAKNGTQLKELVIVPLITFGMETSARNKLFVLETEFGMTQFNNVYVPTNTFGMDLAAWSSQIVAVDKSGTKHPSSVTVLITSIGMTLTVFCA